MGNEPQWKKGIEKSEYGIDIGAKNVRLGSAGAGRGPMEEKSFEQALEELKEIVQILERGERPLDEALSLFEKGVSLVAFCTKRLDEVERKVEALLRGEDGQLRTCPFEELNHSS